jgi:ElaB/YqjD/DUF883 family membrane-anchored ribosome-binding protein
MTSQKIVPPEKVKAEFERITHLWSVKMEIHNAFNLMRRIDQIQTIRHELNSLLCELDSAATSQIKVESAKEKIRELLENLNEQFFTPDNL